ncbi:MAG: diadenylate cyclase [Candidatus Omnitrophica bacterium]|nr:diadenylate cyclase [Candidatus Omnitrophota bacterium]
MFLVVVYSVTFAIGLLNGAFGTHRGRLIQLVILGSITPLFVANFHLSGLPVWYTVFLTGLLICALVWEVSEAVHNLKSRAHHKDFFKQIRKHEGPYAELLKACDLISQYKKGALIVIENKDSLEEWVQKGIQLDAAIDSQLVASVFLSPTSLHDGALVIRGDRVVAGSVIVPLTQSRAVPHEFGTRHRAALGMSEQVDAVSIVVSEETGAVSLAHQGKLYYNLPLEMIPEALAKLAQGKRVVLREPKARETKARESAESLSPLVVETVSR